MCKGQAGHMHTGNELCALENCPSKIMDQLMYVSKAQKAFNEKDYKRCVVLLKRTPLKDTLSVTLFVNACYTAWIHHDPNLSLSEIQESYSTLFSTTDGSLIPSYEFVRLSHIYIKIGSLQGALKTLQYAGFSGHFDSSIVTLQTWTVLKKLNQINEAKRFFFHLCDLIPMETPEEHENGYSFLKSTDIPLSICYIFCGYQLQVESSHCRDNKDLKKRYRMRSDAMLIEAYSYSHLAHPGSQSIYLNWIKNSQTWIEIGIYLEQTPCLLLAEEAYWIAFLCDPHKEERVVECLRLLSEHNRVQESYALCEKMYVYNHWNLLCRKKLLEYNEQKYEPMSAVLILPPPPSPGLSPLLSLTLPPPHLSPSLLSIDSISNTSSAGRCKHSSEDTKLELIGRELIIESNEPMRSIRSVSKRLRK
jgi:hypothetical protein